METMIELLKASPVWFILIVAAGGVALSIALLSRSVTKLDKTIDRFQDLVDKLFEKHEDHESRLSKLEGKCETNHKG